MKEVLSMEEACDYLGVAKPTLYKYARLGVIPAFKVGRVWRFYKESLTDWIKQQVKEDTTVRMKKTRGKERELAKAGK